MRGGERQLLYLACALREAGHESIIACRRGGALEAEAVRLDLERLRLPFLAEWDPLSAALLRQAARRRATENPVVVHAHTGHTASTAFLAGLAGGPPWVVHRRVDFPLSGWLSRRLKYESAGRVIAVSEAIARILREQGLPDEKLAVVRDSVPTDAEEARAAGAALLAPATAERRRELRARLGREWHVDPQAPWVGNLAALVPHKDQATFLRAAANIRERKPGARFWIVGEGPLRGELESLAREIGVADAVRFTGFQKDPGAWLQALDVFVLSSWGEGMGSVLLEAMACGLPIAATTAGGIGEVVEDGRTALLAQPRDPKGLAAAVCRLLDEPGLAQKVAAAAARELKRFSLREAAAKTRQIYEQAWAEWNGDLPSPLPSQAVVGRGRAEEARRR